MSQRNQLDFSTRCVHAGQEPDPTTGAVMMPIYTTSTYVQQSPGVHKGFDYARTKNPTRIAFEALDHGSHVIAVDDLYGGSRRLFERVRRRSMGLDFSYLDLSDAGAIEP